MEKQSRFFAAVSQRWRRLSVAAGFRLFMALVISLVLVIVACSLIMWHQYSESFTGLLDDDYDVSGLSEAFEAQRQAVASYFAVPGEAGPRRVYAQQRKYAREILERLSGPRADSSRNRERYLITQAITTSYGVYDKLCVELLAQPALSKEMIRLYYRTNQIGSYINLYIDQLKEIVLQQNAGEYYARERFLRYFPVLVFGVGFFCVAALLFICGHTLRSWMRFLYALVEASRRISAGDLDTPDVNTAFENEIGELVHTFNEMKHSMRYFITTLKEKVEVEKRLHEEELRRTQADDQLKSAQLSMLQSQINPHFLFNTLNLISRLAKVESAPETEKMILRLSSLFRYNLQAADSDTCLANELKIIGDYIYIQKRRFGSRIGFEIDCRVRPERVQIPTFILQPLIENAVIHGVTPKEDGGRIRIRIRRRRDLYIITVTDNGVGIADDQLMDMLMGKRSHKGHISGIGLDNVRKRIDMLYGPFHFMLFSRKGFGTVARIAIPANRPVKTNAAKEDAIC